MKVTFPEVPEAKWGPYFRDLVALEPSLVFRDSIGYISNYPFMFQVIDPRALHQKLIIYPKAERDWIWRHVDSLVELGILSQVCRGKDPYPLFISSIILVKGG